MRSFSARHIPRATLSWVSDHSDLNCWDIFSRMAERSQIFSKTPHKSYFFERIRKIFASYFCEFFFVVFPFLFFMKEISWKSSSNCFWESFGSEEKNWGKQWKTKKKEFQIIFLRILFFSEKIFLNFFNQNLNLKKKIEKNEIFLMGMKSSTVLMMILASF